MLPAPRVELGRVVERVAERRELLERRARLDGDLVEERDRTEVEDARGARRAVRSRSTLGIVDHALAERDLERPHRHDEALDERPAHLDAACAASVFSATSSAIVSPASKTR